MAGGVDSLNVASVGGSRLLRHATGSALMRTTERLLLGLIAKRIPGLGRASTPIPR